MTWVQSLGPTWWKERWTLGTLASSTDTHTTNRCNFRLSFFAGQEQANWTGSSGRGPAEAASPLSSQAGNASRELQFLNPPKGPFLPGAALQGADYNSSSDDNDLFCQITVETNPEISHGENGLKLVPSFSPHP